MGVEVWSYEIQSQKTLAVAAHHVQVVRSLWEAGLKVDAIRFMRIEHTLSLLEAKNLCEAIATDKPIRTF